MAEEKCIELEPSSTTELTSDATETLGNQTRINTLLENVMDKTKDYLQAELSVTLDEYDLLKRMNQVTTKRYGDLRGTAEEVSTALTSLEEKCNSLSTYFTEIEKIDERVTKLEEIAYSVDAYTKRLETRFKQFEKSSGQAAGSSR